MTPDEILKKYPTGDGGGTAANPDEILKKYAEQPSLLQQLADWLTQEQSRHVGGAGSTPKSFSTPSADEVARINTGLQSQRKTLPGLVTGETTPSGGGDFNLNVFPTAVRNILEGLPKAGSALWDWEREHIPGMQAHTSPALTSQQIEQPIDIGLGAAGMTPESIKERTQYQPQNPSEQLAMGATEFAPALLGGEGALAQKLLTRVGGPMAATEVAGRGAGAIDPALEAPVRFLTGIITGGRPTAPTAELADAVRTLNSTRGGVETLTQLLRNSGMSEAEIRGRLDELGVGPTNLMDVNPVALQAGQQIYAKGGEGRNIMHQALTERAAESGQRTDQTLRSTLGPEVDADARVKALQGRLRQLGNEQKQTHAAQTQPADLQSIVDNIDTRLGTEKSTAVRNALQTARDNLHVKKTAPNQPDVMETASEPILSARQAIDEVLYDARTGKLKEGLGRKTVQALQDVRSQINDALDQANPTLRAKDVQIEQAAKEETAFKSGRKDVLRTGDKALSPDEFNARLAKMSQAEKDQVLAGLTRTIDQIVGLTANNRFALKKAITGEGKWNHEKITALIGDAKANELLQSLKRESAYENTTNRITQNSKTAETINMEKGYPRLEAVADTLTKTGIGGALAGPHGALAGLGLGGMRYLIDRFGGKAADNLRTELARLLASNETNKILKAGHFADQTRGLTTQRVGAVTGSAANLEDRR
jgi:hypothetical protein